MGTIFLPHSVVGFVFVDTLFKRHSDHSPPSEHITKTDETLQAENH